MKKCHQWTQLENDINSVNIQFVPPLVTQIAWASHVEILSSCKSTEEKIFYIVLTASERCNKRELNRQIASGYFERYALSNTKVSPLATQLPAKIARCRVPLNRSSFYM